VARPLLGILAITSVLTICLTTRTEAAKPSHVLLPATTKGYVSVADLEQLIEQWDQTQLGKLMKDPTMQPFVEDLKRQIKARLSKSGASLGISWEELKTVYGGEVSAALIQPWDPSVEQPRIDAAVAGAEAEAKKAKKQADEIVAAGKKAAKLERKALDAERRKQRASVMLVDVTGHLDAAQELLAKVAKNQVEKGATQGVAEVAGQQVAVFTFPKPERDTQARQAFYLIHKDELIASDNADVLAKILGRFAADDPNTLQSVEAYQRVMAGADESFGEQAPGLRWFVEPFGIAEVLRAYNTGRERRGTDFLRVLRNQGFTAVQGIDGFIALSTGEHDIRQFTRIYAPPVIRKPGDLAKTKYDLAARMLEFPNTEELAPQRWVPRGLATHLTFNWKMSDAFWHAESLVNEIAGDDVFDGVIENIELDPHGPQINIKTELTDLLGERATLVTDYHLPITPQSERLLVAIEVTDPATVMRTVNKAMENDPAAKKREHNGHVIWELVNDQTEVAEIQIEGFDSGFGFEDVEEVEEEEAFIPNGAVTVAHGQLMFSSHVDYIVDVLDSLPAEEQLATAADYQAVMQALNKLGAGNDSFKLFTRTDEAYRTTYELMREGKMPESESLLGRLLNRVLADDEDDGELRKQEIDASSLPEFDVVRRYLGPAGMYVRTVDDGWIISGCLLTKQMP